MNILLATSPHLDHSVFHRSGREAIPEGERVAQCFAPMGLVSLAAASKGLADVRIADINKAINSGRLALSRSFYHEAAEWLCEWQPDVVGFMTEADSYHHLLRVFQLLKEKRPSVVTLLGGVHATAVHRETIRQFQQVDFIIRGEGELAFRSFLSCLKTGARLEDVPNLTYRRKDVTVTNPDLPLISDLDSLPFPDFSPLEVAPEDVIYVEIGRGCPFKCNFCFTAPYWQRRHRIKSPARIMRELRYFGDTFGRADFNFTHDLFTTDRRWVIDFCRQLSESDLRVTWTCSSRTDTLDKEQIGWMARAGCRNIYFGVETGTPEMQATIDKNLDLSAARRIIDETALAGIGVTVGFIAGLPGESLASLRGTLKEGFHYLGLPDSTVHMFGFSPYRGSANFDKLRPDLIFDPHFLDFPLPAETHSENCAFMQRYPDVFTRYARPGAHKGSLLEAIRATEELFPTLNALRRLSVALDQRGIDPLTLVTEWAAWISEQHRGSYYGVTGLYQGSIGEFLAFLREVVETRLSSDLALLEMLRWEGTKNALRVVRPGEERSVCANMPGGIRTNETVVVETFANPAAFLDEAERGQELGRGGQFAFYRQRNEECAILRLPPIAPLILELARDGVSRAALLDALSLDLPESEERGLLENLIVDLERRQLLLSLGE